MFGWSITKDDKIAMHHKAIFNSETKEMEEKKTLYELSEDGKKLKNCTEGSEEVVEFKEKWQLNEINDTDQAGAIITMHEYVV